MYITCQAIVLHLTPHTDKTTLLHLYSREHGRVCVAVSGIHGKKSNVRSALFAPLTPLHVTLQEKNGHLRLHEANISAPYASIATVHNKRSVAFFIAELLMHSLQEQDADEDLFDFLSHSIQQLETEDFSPDFHLHLMMQLTHYLGFFPNIENEGDFFDLNDGIRRTLRPNHPHYLSPSATILFFALCESHEEVLHITRSQRQELLENLLHYYQLHLPYFGKMRSVAILQELFD